MNKLFTTVAAGNYVAGFGTAKGAQLRSINYQTGEVYFSLIASDDSVAPTVNGIVVAGVSEQTVAEAIRATIAATNG